jgi:S1-C subfamily serine protease
MRCWLVVILVLGAIYVSPCLGQKEGAAPTPTPEINLPLLIQAAESGDPNKQYLLGWIYAQGRFGVHKDSVEAVKWFRKAAEQGLAKAQNEVGIAYANGLGGVPKDDTQAVKWYRMAAEQGDAEAQCDLGVLCCDGTGTLKNEVEAYKWFLLSASQGNARAKKGISVVENRITPIQRAEGQRAARDWKPNEAMASSQRSNTNEPPRPIGSGTAFAISQDGFFVTNEHVVQEFKQIRLITAKGTFTAEIVAVDRATDLALLKIAAKTSPLAIASSRTLRLGATVATVGFPNITLQGFSPKLAKGEIASLAGIQDDPKQFQISVPVQPGNSGGPMIDEKGNVVGVIVAKLNQQAALATTGTLAENVNYAIKSSFLLAFLESVPNLANKLSEPASKVRNFEDVVEETKQATALVLVY